MAKPYISLRTAFVGVGWAGSRQIAALREIDTGIVPAWVVDAVEETARRVAEENSIPCWTTQLDEALEDDDLEAVSICTPHTQHKVQAIAAADARKHVLCEKPIALSVSDGLEMVDAARSAGVSLYVAESAAYTQRARLLTQMVVEERLGELVGASFEFGFTAKTFEYEGRRSWLTDPRQGGAATWMLHGIHTVAEIRSVLGPIEAIDVRMRTCGRLADRDEERTVAGSVFMKSGLVVRLYHSSEVQPPAGQRFTIIGNRATVVADQEGYAWIEHHRHLPQQELKYADSPSAYALELSAFHHYVNTGVGITDASRELENLATVIAGYESSRLGGLVSVASVMENRVA